MSLDRDAFVSARRSDWDRLERLLGKDWPAPSDWSEIGGLYRAVCGDLSRARTQRLGDDLTSYLDAIAGRAHNRLYGVPSTGGVGFIELIARDVPREVRASWRLFALAMVLFYGPLIIGIIGAVASPDFATAVMPAQQLAQMEQNFGGDLSRGGGEDAMMAGFYVLNNVGIAFRCFATGALGGLGSMFFLVYNGLVIGTATGYLATTGSLVGLLTFISGHGPWELTGIVLAGTAGMRLGWSLIDTGGKTRAGSLRAAAPGLFRLVAGAAAMLLVAASIEGFWSAGPMPAFVKWGFGLVQVGIVTAWLSLGGRGGAPR